MYKLVLNIRVRAYVDVSLTYVDTESIALGDFQFLDNIRLH